jgi:AcrR family transcriptional regulator
MLEVGVQLLAERGLEKLSLMEIGVAAGYSRGLPAHHFGSKAKYLAALASFIAVRYCEEIEQHQDPPGLDALIRTLRGAFQLADDPLGVAVTYVVLSDKVRTPPFGNDLGDLKAGSLDTVRRNLHAGIRNGEIRSDIDVDRLANVILVTTWGLQGEWLRDRDFDLPAAGEEFISLLKPGLTPAVDKPDRQPEKMSSAALS